VALKKFLIANSFYTAEEYYRWNKDWFLRRCMNCCDVGALYISWNQTLCDYMYYESWWVFIMYVNSYVILIYGMYCLYSSPVVLNIYSLDDDDYLCKFFIIILLTSSISECRCLYGFCGTANEWMNEWMLYV
jgi:hypothetical protein